MRSKSLLCKVSIILPSIQKTIIKVIQSVFKSERFPFGGTQNLRPSIVQLTRHYKSLWKLKTRKILLLVACVLLGD